ncbi:MAG: glycoside hydrolase family 3 protein, partial [Kiritimatiellaceae bacterium]|nr:glycoside hydrolase family 3 protein [Kiritimatiellaceae bacterium]
MQMKCWSQWIFNRMVLIVLLTASLSLQAQEPFQNPSLSIDERVADLLGRMTLEEKADLTAGTIRGPDGIRQGADATRAIEIKNGPGGKSFTLPKMLIAHGPYGFRGAYSGENGDITIQYGTAFPSSVNLACMWDPELLEEICAAMGLEMRSYGFHVSAGPAFNIIRDPHNGRAVEYFTEDPYLNSVLVAHYIPALQKTGMVAVPKHFAANNTER